MKVRKVKVVRVAFLTDSSFQRENEMKQGMLKKRALRELQRRCRVLVVEDSTNPDLVYTVYRRPGEKSWCLRQRVEGV